jgi:uncharacterized protein YbbK (DUF523 family)
VNTSSNQNQPVFFSTSSAKEPVLVSACFLGIPCRWHGRRAKRRDEFLDKLKEKYVIVPVCPEQLGGMSTPRTSEMLPQGKTGVDVLDNGVRLIAPETGEDVTDFHIRGGEYSLEIAQIVGIKRAYLKGGSPSCDKDGIVGEILRRGGVLVVRVG